jgi:hypothetical protein
MRGRRAESVGPAIATPHIDHPSADRLRAIGAADIGDDDVGATSHRNLSDHAADRLRLVEGRNDEGQRLHRIPQFWHGAGGASDRRFVRKSR